MIWLKVCLRVLFVAYCVMAYGSFCVFFGLCFVCLWFYVFVCLVCDLFCGVVWFVVFCVFELVLFLFLYLCGVL